MRRGFGRPAGPRLGSRRFGGVGCGRDGRHRLSRRFGLGIGCLEGLDRGFGLGRDCRHRLSRRFGLGLGLHLGRWLRFPDRLSIGGQRRQLATSLRRRFVQEDGTGDGSVQRRYPTAHRDPNDGVATAAYGRPEALAFAANDYGDRTAKVGLTGRKRRLGLGADDPEAVDVKVGKRFCQIVDGNQQEVLDRSGRSLDGGRRERRLMTGRKDHAVDAGRLGRSKKRTEVLGVLERVQDQGERGLFALDRPGQKVVDGREAAPVGDQGDSLMPVEPGQRRESASLDFDYGYSQTRRVEHELLERLTALRHDQKTVSGTPGEERLFDRVAPGDQLLFLAHEVRWWRAAWRSGPMSVGTGGKPVGATRPGCSRTGSEGTAVVAARPFGSASVPDRRRTGRHLGRLVNDCFGRGGRSVVRRRHGDRWLRRLDYGVGLLVFAIDGFERAQVAVVFMRPGLRVSLLRPKAESSSRGTRTWTGPGLKWGARPLVGTRAGAKRGARSGCRAWTVVGARPLIETRAIVGE